MTIDNKLSSQKKTKLLSQSPEEVHSKRTLRGWEFAALFVGLVGILIHQGVRQESRRTHLELGSIAILSLVVIVVCLAIRYQKSRARQTFLRQHSFSITISLVWLVGLLIGLGCGVFLWWNQADLLNWKKYFIGFSEGMLLLWILVGSISAVRASAARGWNPALVFVGSFLILIATGTILLMLPRSKAIPEQHISANRQISQNVEASAPFQKALFTAVSASCVTGLVVEPTGTYWSRFGQSVILILFQLGGLGIMTFGAFFALALGGNFQIRETATMRELLDSEHVGDVRRLLRVILLFTIGMELLGTVLLWDFFPEGTFLERAFLCLFHSVSAFCNAGFSLTENSFVGRATSWQVWGVIAWLIITGGLGFAVIYNLALVLKARTPRFSEMISPPLFHHSPHRIRLSLTSKLVLLTSLLLLIGGGDCLFYLRVVW